MRLGLWITALCFSLLVHAAFVGIYLAADHPAVGIAQESGEGGIDIGLGMAGTYSDLAALEAPVPETSPLDETESRPKEPQAPQEEPDPAPEIEVVNTALPTRNLVRETSEKPIRKVEETAEKVMPTPEVPPVNTEAPTQAVAPNDALPVARQAASKKATGQTNSNKSGAKKGDANHYFGEIMSWLGKYKHYPVELKRQKKQGVVSVEFSIDRNGYLLSARIKKGSGYAELDEAAMAMLDSASPLPAMPDWMDKPSLTLSIPVEYSLITNSSFKE